MASDEASKPGVCTRVYLSWRGRKRMSLVGIIRRPCRRSPAPSAGTSRGFTPEPAICFGQLREQVAHRVRFCRTARAAPAWRPHALRSAGFRGSPPRPLEALTAYSS